MPDTMNTTKAREFVGLLNVPDDILREIIKLVVREPKDGLRMMGSCSWIRKLVTDMKLQAMTKLQHVLHVEDKSRVQLYGKFVELVNLSGPWVQSLDFEAVAVNKKAGEDPDTYTNAELSEESVRKVTSLLPELVDVRVHGCRWLPSAWLLDQLAAVAPNVQRLSVKAPRMYDNVLLWMTRLPLEKLELLRSWKSPSDILRGVFESCRLQTVRLGECSQFDSTSWSESHSRMCFSMHTLLWMVSKSGKTMESLVVGDSTRLIEDCDVESFNLDDCQCKFMELSGFLPSACLTKICHRNLQHLHLDLLENCGAICANLFKNGRFSLRSVRFAASGSDGGDAISALVSRNPHLEVLRIGRSACFSPFEHFLHFIQCSGRLPAPQMRSSALEGFRDMKYLRFLFVDSLHTDAAAFFAFFSSDRHPHLQYCGWGQNSFYGDSEVSAALRAVKKAAPNMSGSTLRVQVYGYGRMEICSHTLLLDNAGSTLDAAAKGTESFLRPRIQPECEACQQLIRLGGCCMRRLSYFSSNE